MCLCWRSRLTPAEMKRSQMNWLLFNGGGADGIRTRDLRRDRPAF